jgi:hypothetical protein
MDTMRGSPREGWAVVLTIRDLGTLTPQPAAASTSDLFGVWSDEWACLGKNAESAQRISKSIDRARDDVRGILFALQ